MSISKPIPSETLSDGPFADKVREMKITPELMEKNGNLVTMTTMPEDL